MSFKGYVIKEIAVKNETSEEKSMKQLSSHDISVFRKIQEIKNTLAIERYGKPLTGLSKEQQSSVSMDAVEQYFRGALLWGRTNKEKERFEKLSYEELFEEMKQ